MNLNIQTRKDAPNSDCCPTHAREGISNQSEGVTPIPVENTSISSDIRKDAGVLMGGLKRQLATPTSLAAKPTNGVFVGIVDTSAGVIIGAPISQNYAETNRVWQFIKNLQANEKTVPCRDKTIVAVLTHKPTGQKFYGTNGIKRDVGYCPRNESNHRMNDGYDKCRNICRQEHHAEIAALLLAVRHVPNLPLNQCVIDVYGTHQVCNNCQMVLDKHGVYINGVYPNLEEMKS